MAKHEVLPGGRFDLAHFGELVGDPSRAAMLLSLMDGRQRPAGELAALASVSASTASEHLRLLREGGLVAVGRAGRHRYYRIADDEVAHALETVALRSRPRPSSARTPLEKARTCYRHLAGELGVSLFDGLSRRGWLRLREGALRLEPEARSLLPGLADAPGKPCLDWTERRNHLGGPLGVALATHLFERGWLARSREGRAVRVTAPGSRGLARLLGG